MVPRLRYDDDGHSWRSLRLVQSDNSLFSVPQWQARVLSLQIVWRYEGNALLHNALLLETAPQRSHSHVLGKS